MGRSSEVSPSDASKKLLKSKLNPSTKNGGRSHFALGTDKDRHQTTQQFNDTLRNRCLSARGVIPGHKALNNNLLNRTQFKLGYQDTKNDISPNYPVSSQEPIKDPSKHKILGKSANKNHGHSHIFGNTKVDYKSSNTASYHKLELGKNPLQKGKNFHTSELAEQQKKQNNMMQQSKNIMAAAINSGLLTKTNKFYNNMGGPKKTRESMHNYKRSHFTFGNSKERSNSPYEQYYDRNNLNKSSCGLNEPQVKIYSKGQPRPKSNIRFADERGMNGSK